MIIVVPQIIALTANQDHNYFLLHKYLMVNFEL